VAVVPLHDQDIARLGAAETGAGGRLVSPVRLEEGNWTWHVLPGFLDEFRRQQPALLAALEGGEGERVKHGKHRTVFALPGDAPRLYVKLYRVADGRARLNRWLLGPRAGREWKLTQEVLRRGVPTLRPIAWAVRGGLLGGESCLVTIAEPGADQLDKLLIEDAPECGPCLRTRSSPEQRRTLIAALAQLIARAHRVGVDHGDLHAGNVLVRIGPNGPELLLIDLLACRLSSGPLSRRRCWQNLLCLGVSVLKYTTPFERYAFLREYLRHWPEWGAEPRAVARKLEAALWEAARRAWWKRDEQCVRENRRFYFMWEKNALTFAVRALPRHVARRMAEIPGLLLADGKLLKESPSTRVVRTGVGLFGEERQVLWKEFRPKSWMDRVRASLYRTPAMRSWRGAHVLQHRGLPTPDALMLVETCQKFWPDASYLLTEYVPDSATLAAYVAEQLRHNPGELRWRRELTERLARIVRYMHQCCVSHRDLKFSNWLVVADRDGTIRRILIIDLAGVQVWRRLPKRRIVQNLARLWISAQSNGCGSPTDALRFLRTYLPRREFERGWKRWWRSIQKFAHTKVQQNKSAGRVLS